MTAFLCVAACLFLLLSGRFSPGARLSRSDLVLIGAADSQFDLNFESIGSNEGEHRKALRNQQSARLL